MSENEVKITLEEFREVYDRLFDALDHESREFVSLTQHGETVKMLLEIMPPDGSAITPAALDGKYQLDQFRAALPVSLHRDADRFLGVVQAVYEDYFPSGNDIYRTQQGEQ